MSLRLIFMGTPDFAVPTLLDLVAHGHEIAAVYTRAAKPGGRGMKLQLSPVEVEAKRPSGQIAAGALPAASWGPSARGARGWCRQGPEGSRAS